MSPPLPTGIWGSVRNLGAPREASGLCACVLQHHEGFWGSVSSSRGSVRGFGGSLRGFGGLWTYIVVSLGDLQVCKWIQKDFEGSVRDVGVPEGVLGSGGRSGGTLQRGWGCPAALRGGGCAESFGVNRCILGAPLVSPGPFVRFGWNKGNLCFSPLSCSPLSPPTGFRLLGPARASVWGSWRGSAPSGAGTRRPRGRIQRRSWAPSPRPGPSCRSTCCTSGRRGRCWGRCRPCPPPPPPALAALARSPPGSRVWDALLACPAVPARARRRLLRKLKGHFLSLACHRNGSRVLDAVWASASAVIAEGLASQRDALQHDPHGRGVARTSSSAAAACGSSYRRPLTAAGGSWDPSWRTDACPGAQSGVPGDREASSWMTIGHREEEQAQSVPAFQQLRCPTENRKDPGATLALLPTPLACSGPPDHRVIGGLLARKAPASVPQSCWRTGDWRGRLQSPSCCEHHGVL
ncbi:uncharacterized protein LOC142051391 [Phalacrocorax aristotelis]|uniref:uncharacterized protein LOC142051391 n=1 Tax=Phalacrocorax aristotelis TaxID=126867 RepID=UPI003F4BF9DA